MEDPRNPQVFIECQGMCGRSLIIPFNIACEFFHPNGSLKPEYRDVNFICSECASWIQRTDHTLEGALERLLNDPEGTN